MINRPPPRQSLLGAGYLWLGLDLMFAVFLIIGGWFGFNSWRLVSTGGHAPGEVVELEPFHSEGSTTYSPVVEYVVDGETYTFHGGSASDPPAYHVGQEVEMLYDRAHPGTAQINDFWELWLLPLIFIPIGVIGGLVCTGIFIIQVFLRLRAGQTLL